VPGDVAVTGFDDIYPGRINEPSITTVHQPMRLLGERACDRLLDRLARPGLRRRTELLPVDLVLRESCGCPPGTDIRQRVTRVRTTRSAMSRPVPRAGREG
jgi:DNA-binding LacI/PurR family transcriptional regulator